MEDTVDAELEDGSGVRGDDNDSSAEDSDDNEENIGTGKAGVSNKDDLLLGSEVSREKRMWRIQEETEKHLKEIH
jgi:hypothetical protein